MKISVYIIAYNEAEKIRDCINSVLWADEIIVVDSHSTDGTSEIAEELGAKVVHIPFEGYGDLRNKAISHCNGEWIFSLDSDERCTEEARDEILALIENAPLDIYRVPRKNYFMGRWIKHSGWYPNFRQPQLFRNGKMSYDLKPVHEGFVCHSDKKIGVISNIIWQLPFKNTEEVIHKANRYSTLGVEKLQDKGEIGGVFKATNNASPMVTMAGVLNKPEYQALETERFLKKHQTSWQLLCLANGFPCFFSLIRSH